MKPTVIITGGTKGLGRETSLQFGAAGYQVLSLYASDDAAAQALREDFAARGLTGTVLRHDICAEDSAFWNQPEIQEAENLTLVHNACASFLPSAMHQLTWRDFESNFLVAVKGAWECSRAVVRAMIRRKRGTMVTVLSNAIEGPCPKGFAAYAAAKHALHGFTLALASEYADRGIKVFSISPGYMETPLTRQWPERLREAIQAHATRITSPVEAAQRLVELVETASTPGRGENYPV